MKAEKKRRSMQGTGLINIQYDRKKILNLLGQIYNPSCSEREFVQAKLKEICELKDLSYGLADLSKQNPQAVMVVLREGRYIQTHIEEVLNRSVQMLILEALLDSMVNPVSVATVRELVAEFVLKPMHKRLSVRTKGGDTKTKYEMPLAKREQFTTYYYQYQKEWRSAKKEYKQVNKQSANSQAARKAVKAKYPLLPKDLIDRLSDLDHYESSPRNLALQHAARCCGIPDGTYPSDTLRKFLIPKRQRGISIDELKRIFDEAEKVEMEVERS